MKTAKFFTVVLGAACLVAATAPAFGQDIYGQQETDKRFKKIEKDLHEVRAIVLQAKATGQPVEVRTASSDDQIAAIQSRLDDIEQTVRGLTGQVETLSHAADLAKAASAANQSQVAALSDRVDKLEKALAALTPPPAAQAGGAGPAAPDQGAPAEGGGAEAAYVNARQLLLNGDYPAAGDAFQQFLTAYPASPNAQAARYWLGEVKYTQGDYDAAASDLVGAIHGWPKTNWAPDAMVKLALSLVQLKKSTEACTTLHALARHYPETPSATRARAAAARAKAGCGR